MCIYSKAYRKKKTLSICEQNSQNSGDRDEEYVCSLIDSFVVYALSTYLSIYLYQQCVVNVIQSFAIASGIATTHHTMYIICNVGIRETAHEHDNLSDLQSSPTNNK